MTLAIHKFLFAIFKRSKVALFIIIYTCFCSSLLAVQDAPVKAKQGTESVGSKKTGSGFDWFWILYEKDNSQPGYNSFNIRPFYGNFQTYKKQKHSVTENFLKTPGNRSLSFQSVLMPVIYWDYRNDKAIARKWLFGLGSAIDYKHSKKNIDTDIGLFPLFFYGASPDEKDKYLLVWPFGGTLKQKFGIEKITTVLFPGIALFFIFPPATVFAPEVLVYGFLSLIPLYSTYEQKDYRAWSILWPLIYRGKSKKRNDIRILPFYSRMRKKGWYDNISVLLIINKQTYFYREDVHHTFFLFPLVGRKWSDSGEITSTTILWPLFSWGYDKRYNDRSYNLPWPFVQIRDRESSPKIKTRIFFPFYGEHIISNNRTFFITPLHFTYTENSPSYKSKYIVNFLIFWSFSREYIQKPHEFYGNKWSLFKIWPLLSVEQSDTGFKSINILSALPFRDPLGYEKMYNPLWSIFEYRRFKNGEKRLGVLLRLYYQRWGEQYFEAQIPLVFSYSRSRKKIINISILLSMFGYQSNDKGDFLKILWIPIPLKKAENKPVTPPMQNQQVPVEENKSEKLKSNDKVKNRAFKQVGLSIAKGIKTKDLNMVLKKESEIKKRMYYYCLMKSTRRNRVSKDNADQTVMVTFKVFQE